MSHALRLCLSLMCCHLVFAAWPALDLAVSGWFFEPRAGFAASQLVAAGALRQAIWTLGLGLLVALLTLSALAALMPLRIRPTLWLRGAACLLLGPGLLVNVLFKAHWGRARPRDVTQFGGEAIFTPPVQIADQCATNCSFMSGEGALAITAALVLWRLAAPMVTGRARWLLAAGLALFAATGAGLRIVMGAHFLSDTVFAGLLCGFVWLALMPARGTHSAADLRLDALLLRRTGRRLAQKLISTPGSFSSAIRSRSS